MMTVVDGFARVFFREAGEQTVALTALRVERAWEQRVVESLQPATAERLRRLALALQAVELPLLDSAAVLTAAKVDLLPHQIVLTHRVATAIPRRFLIADDVGLGKTIEAALILRELASRGELRRALMVVPAGLVDNWRRELNEVFRLDFEVFGADGDVTDRSSNAFARHDRLIASIDTLKRATRRQRLAEAPPWDLVVFDEAHHLTAIRSGTSTRKTDNYKLAEQLRNHCRDLLLLSATPHQGDQFRFLALIRLLAPTLFLDERDMIDNRHRLNTVMIRRTKADACRTDGSPLFARRQVHSQAFALTAAEQRFYEALTAYIRDGYALAAAQGGKARAVGFVMTVFQKIAASSFAAVRRTLERRLLALTIHEAIARDAMLDVSGRDHLLREARAMLASMHRLDDSSVGRAEVERLLAEARVRLLKRLKAEQDLDVEGSEHAADGAEEAAANLVEYALPEERQRIRALLDLLPDGLETKARELLRALEQLWAENPREKVIIFTTYLGSVDSLTQAIDERFPAAGIEVLKGGDHGAKLTAERRFRRPDGPRVLICTAAGREGINLQFARVLVNHDLPWNPMDLEQRIGRIHRYGQNDTVQVYNLVAMDTIEGKVFLLLEQKIEGVGRALGKVDERGEVAEDLRGQILGQLGERLSFTHLYQEALRDPTLQRTSLELEVALANASQAREVVGDLFQDLEPFRLDEYRPADAQGGLERLISFVGAALPQVGGSLERLATTCYRVHLPGLTPIDVTTDRDEAMANEQLALVGLEHPAVADLLGLASGLPADQRALVVQGADLPMVTSVWELRVTELNGGQVRRLLHVRVDDDGRAVCLPLESQPIAWDVVTGANVAAKIDRDALLTNQIPSAIRASLVHSGALTNTATFTARLLAWLERGVRREDASAQ